MSYYDDEDHKKTQEEPDFDSISNVEHSYPTEYNPRQNPKVMKKLRRWASKNRLFRLITLMFLSIAVINFLINCLTFITSSRPIWSEIILLIIYATMIVVFFIGFRYRWSHSHKQIRKFRNLLVGELFLCAGASFLYSLSYEDDGTLSLNIYDFSYMLMGCLFFFGLVIWFCTSYYKFLKRNRNIYNYYHKYLPKTPISSLSHYSGKEELKDVKEPSQIVYSKSHEDIHTEPI
jgi:hypothetical protein